MEYFPVYTDSSLFPELILGGGGSGMLGTAIAFNAVSAHGTCTAVFVAVAAIIVILLSSIRTLGKISFLAWGGLVSLVVSGKYGASVQWAPSQHLR